MQQRYLVVETVDDEQPRVAAAQVNAQTLSQAAREDVAAARFYPNTNNIAVRNKPGAVAKRVEKIGTKASGGGR